MACYCLWFLLWKRDKFYTFDVYGGSQQWILKNMIHEIKLIVLKMTFGSAGGHGIWIE